MSLVQYNKSIVSCCICGNKEDEKHGGCLIKKNEKVPGSSQNKTKLSADKRLKMTRNRNIRRRIRKLILALNSQAPLTREVVKEYQTNSFFKFIVDLNQRYRDRVNDVIHKHNLSTFVT